MICKNNTKKPLLFSRNKRNAKSYHKQVCFHHFFQGSLKCFHQLQKLEEKKVGWVIVKEDSWRIILIKIINSHTDMAICSCFTITCTGKSDMNPTVSLKSTFFLKIKLGIIYSEVYIFNTINQCTKKRLLRLDEMVNCRSNYPEGRTALLTLGSTVANSLQFM